MIFQYLMALTLAVQSTGAQAASVKFECVSDLVPAFRSGESGRFKLVLQPGTQGWPGFAMLGFILPDRNPTKMELFANERVTQDPARPGFYLRQDVGDGTSLTIEMDGSTTAVVNYRSKSQNVPVDERHDPVVVPKDLVLHCH